MRNCIETIPHLLYIYVRTLFCVNKYIVPLINYYAKDPKSQARNIEGYVLYVLSVVQYSDAGTEQGVRNCTGRYR